MSQNTVVASRVRSRRFGAACATVLAMVAVATDAAASPEGSVPSILYDQAAPGSGGASPTQQMGFANDEIADDFEVTDAAGWTVTSVKFAIDFVSQGGLDPGQPPYLIAFYADDAGMPAANALCEFDSAPGTYDNSVPGGELNVSVVLPTPCALAPGRYWLAMSVVMDSTVNSLWAYVTTAMPGYFSEPVYRNPDNHWGTNCVDWTHAYTSQPPCLINFSSGQMPNMMFQVLGTISADDVLFEDGFDL